MLFSKDQRILLRKYQFLLNKILLLYVLSVMLRMLLLLSQEEFHKKLHFHFQNYSQYQPMLQLR